MSPRIQYQRITTLRHSEVPQADFGALLAEEVGARFEQATGIPVVMVAVYPQAWQALDADVVHPLCRPFAKSAHCRQVRREHLEQLRRTPEILWHHCPHGLLCAMVPLCREELCPAACQLVCLEAVSSAEFQSHVHLLEVLVENFILRYGHPPTRPEGAGRTAGGPLEPVHHPRVSAAVSYIQRHLTNPTLTVRAVAGALDVNTTYLAHLFAQHTGSRMSHYIACRRIRLARRLLRSTTWQIKRVALACGFANPDWFSEVFHVHCGMTPTAFRRQYALGRMT